MLEDYFGLNFYLGCLGLFAKFVKEKNGRHVCNLFIYLFLTIPASIPKYNRRER